MLIRENRCNDWHSRQRHLISAGVDGMVRAAQFLGELYLSCVFLWGRHCLYALQILMIISSDLY